VSTKLFPDKTSKIHCFEHEDLKEAKAIRFSKPYKDVVRRKEQKADRQTDRQTERKEMCKEELMTSMLNSGLKLQMKFELFSKILIAKISSFQAFGN